jgi:hypothetical protein
MREEKLKKCSICQTEKPLSEFNNDKNTLDGKGYKCRDCNRKLNKEYREKHPNLMKDYYQQNKEKHKAKVRKYMNEVYYPKIKAEKVKNKK